MAHQSDHANRLAIRTIELANLKDFPTPSAEEPAVWLFVLPYGRASRDGEMSKSWWMALQQFASSLHERSVVAILTTPEDAAETWPQLEKHLHFQLWVAVKLQSPRNTVHFQLPGHHAALLILSKYRGSLQHTKTRIGYSYCPYCDKTTKDYGGKKHTYHEYGTLVSDVWRDIEYRPGEPSNEITTRLADLFGLVPYRNLFLVDVTAIRHLQPRRAKTLTYTAQESKQSIRFESRLVRGDSLEELRKLPANSVDFCYADPPYNLAKRYDSWDDAIDVRDYLTWCDRWLDELARVLRPGRTCAVLNIPILAIRHFQYMKSNLVFQSWIAWEGLSLPVRMIMPAHYATVCFSKGPSRPLPGLLRESHSQQEASALSTLRENYCVRQSCISERRREQHPDREPITDLWWDIHRLKHNSRRVEHPCQLPPALMRRLIALFTNEGEIVLDPFNGAGTTTLCAAGLDRRFLGIEISEDYHKLALSRHQKLADGYDPFEKAKHVPQAKNSRVHRIGGMKYEIPKKTLQLEVKRVSHELGRMPTREELEQFGRYPIRYYDEYFLSWGEVCAAARTTGMTESRNIKTARPTSQLSLFQDIAEA